MPVSRKTRKCHKTRKTRKTRKSSKSIKSIKLKKNIKIRGGGNLDPKLYEKAKPYMIPKGEPIRPGDILIAVNGFIAVLDGTVSNQMNERAYNHNKGFAYGYNYNIKWIAIPRDTYIKKLNKGSDEIILSNTNYLENNSTI